MDDTFRDRNANQNASALLYACKQFRDESLSSFLPRFEQLLSRSLKSSAEDEHKIYDLHNALNQTTRTHLIGHSLPTSFREFVEKLSVVGSQIDGVGLVKTRSYISGQQGIFDDGTRGITGGKLLINNTRNNFLMPALVPNPASYQCSSTPPETVKDADGDTRMTG
ncbi:hypothetical protein K3495_g17362, partial [Podosphaera aphanis]